MFPLWTDEIGAVMRSRLSVNPMKFAHHRRNMSIIRHLTSILYMQFYLSPKFLLEINKTLLIAGLLLQGSSRWNRWRNSTLIRTLLQCWTGSFVCSMHYRWFTQTAYSFSSSTALASCWNWPIWPYSFTSQFSHSKKQRICTSFPNIHPLSVIFFVNDSFYLH